MIVSAPVITFWNVKQNADEKAFYVFVRYISSNQVTFVATSIYTLKLLGRIASYTTLDEGRVKASVIQ